MVIVGKVDIELGSFDVGFLAVLDVQVIAVQFQLREFVIQRGEIHTQIDQRADEHIAADATEDIQIQRFHLCNIICGSLPYGPDN